MGLPDQEKKRQDPRVKRTRKLINQAFFELMNEKGFQSITVQDITDRAEVHRATFYSHYEDKYDLLDSYAREGFRDWLSKKTSASGELNLERLQQLVATVFEFLAAMDAHCSPDKQLEPMLEAAVQEELSEFHLAWFKQSPPASISLRQSPETVAMLWGWAIFGAGSHWSRGERTFSAVERAAQVVEALTEPLVLDEKTPNRQVQVIRA